MSANLANTRWILRFSDAFFKRKKNANLRAEIFQTRRFANELAMKHTHVLFLALAAFAALALFTPVRATGLAAVTISNCSDDTELRNQLTALQSGTGGTLTFNCGTATIKLSSQLPDITQNTVIDGGGKITLSGNDLVRLFRVGSDGQLKLKYIVLDQGFGGDTFGGAVLSQGYLTLDHATIQYSHSAYDGGAIASFNQLEIIDSLLTNNYANYGGAIYADDLVTGARVTITNSKFLTNHSSRDGGAVSSSAPLEIAGGEFVDNKAANAAAISARSVDGPSTIRDSTFQDNQTTGTGNDGNGGALLIDNTTVKIQNTLFQHNYGLYGGAFYVLPGGDLTITDSTLGKNRSYFEGGGVYNKGSAALTNVTLVGNTSAYGSGVENYGLLTMTNATFSGNTGEYTGALGNDGGGTASLTNVTFSGNSALDTTGAGIENSGKYTVMYLKNVLVAAGSTGDNCKFIQAPTISESNLSSDYSCYFGVGREHLDLKLGALANNGGLTQTHLPQAGSPAIDGGNIGDCPATDQRGIHRPQMATCDVGAVEVEATTPTATRTATRTATATRTPTKTATPNRTATKTATVVHTATRTPTRTATPTDSTCAGRPAKPSLLKPGDSKKARGPVVRLDWNDTLCAQSFKVIIKIGSPRGARFQKKGGLSSSEFTTKEVSPGQTYAWRVIAFNGAIKTKSDWWTFKVK